MDGEGTSGVEFTGVSVKLVVQGVDFEDMRKDAFVLRVCKLPPRGGTDPLPRVIVDMLLSICFYHQESTTTKKKTVHKLKV